MFPEDTIIAQASASGGGKRGILRLSGEESDRVLESILAEKFFGGDRAKIARCSLYPWGPITPVPSHIYYWPQGKGFTGQKSIELHTVGSQPVLDAILRVILQDNRVRMAEPGEFTFRAFLSGKIDLVQAEAVLGVIDAVDKSSLKVALNQLAGGIGGPIAKIRDILFETLCHLEAGFDFADEEIEFLSQSDLKRVLDDSLGRIETALEQMESRTDSVQLPRIALIGKTNVGKSRLFNALIGEGKAIVSDVSGTTRDYLEGEIEHEGVRFKLLDTAGLMDIDPTERPDKIAWEMTENVLSSADILVLCTDSECLGGWEERVLDNSRFTTIPIRTKSDLRDGVETDFLSVSSKTGDGLPNLLDTIREKLLSRSSGGSAVLATSIRCQSSLEKAKTAIERAVELANQPGMTDESLIASEIRVALDGLGLVLGTVHTEDILDAIFSRFCIGK